MAFNPVYATAAVIVFPYLLATAVFIVAFPFVITRA